MRLLMFPIMVCNTKKCRGKSTHLSLKVTLCKKVEHPYKAGMVKKILSKIEYKFLYYATKCCGATIPEVFKPDDINNEEFLHLMHSILFEMNIEEGQMECPDCKKIFTINKGIANMVLQDDEI